MALLSARRFILSCSIAALATAQPLAAADEVAGSLEPPEFHHVHLNSTDPDSAVSEYLTAVPHSVRTSFADETAFRTANDVLLVFSPVDQPPLAPLPDRISKESPQTAFWHFVFASGDIRETYRELSSAIPEFSERLLPLYTGPEGDSVAVSADTYPGFLTAEEIEAARRDGVEPRGNGGYLNWVGPDGAILEHAQIPGQEDRQGLTIFGMFHSQPNCAVQWYVRHLQVVAAPRRGDAPPALPGSADCTVELGNVPSYPSTYRRGHIRVPPPTGVNISGVFLRWYMNQEDLPLAPMRGSVVDHFALSVADLGPWIDRFEKAGLTFIKGPEPYRVGNLRAVMIEGPSREAIELVEVARQSEAIDWSGRDSAQTEELSDEAVSVLELDRQAEDALNRMDVEFLETVFADDLVFTHGDAWTESGSVGFVTDKRRWLDFIANSNGMFTEKHANTQRIEMHDDIAIVQARSSGKNKGEAYEIWYLRVYAKRDNRWQLISHKTVRGPQPPTNPAQPD